VHYEELQDFEVPTNINEIMEKAVGKTYGKY
jgi:hypothetical protein